MKHLSLINKDGLVKGILTLHVDDIKIEDIQFEKEETDEVIEISDELFQNVQELTTTITSGTMIVYNKETQDVEIKNIIENEDRVI